MNEKNSKAKIIFSIDTELAWARIHHRNLAPKESRYVVETLAPQAPNCKNTFPAHAWMRKK